MQSPAYVSPFAKPHHLLEMESSQQAQLALCGRPGVTIADTRHSPKWTFAIGAAFGIDGVSVMRDLPVVGAKIFDVLP